jgi:hypothetical protein
MRCYEPSKRTPPATTGKSKRLQVAAHPFDHFLIAITSFRHIVRVNSLRNLAVTVFIKRSGLKSCHCSGGPPRVYAVESSKTSQSKSVKL